MTISPLPPLVFACILAINAVAQAQTALEPAARCADFERQSNGFLLQFQRGFATPELLAQSLLPVVGSFERCLDSPTSKRLSPKTMLSYKRQVAGLQTTHALFLHGSKACHTKAKVEGATRDKPVNCDWTNMPVGDALSVAQKKHPELVVPAKAPKTDQKLGELSKQIIKANVFGFGQQ